MHNVTVYQGMYVNVDLTQAHSHILHWGHRSCEGALFLKKVDFLLVVAVDLKTWALGSPQNTSGRENSITLLNKAGPTSQQASFFREKNPLNRRLEAMAPCPPATPLTWPFIGNIDCLIEEHWLFFLRCNFSYFYHCWLLNHQDQQLY